MRRWSAVIAIALTLIGCGAASEELVIIGSDSTGCSYDGPAELAAGVHKLVIGPSGGGHLIATVHEIDTDVTPAQIVDHYQAGGDPFPEFMTPVATIERVNPLAFVTESHQFHPGEHVIVCIEVDSTGPDVARPIAFLTVTEN